MKNKNELVLTGFRIPKKLKDKVQMHGILKGLTQSEVAIKAFEEFLEKNFLND